MLVPEQTTDAMLETRQEAVRRMSRYLCAITERSLQINAPAIDPALAASVVDGITIHILTVIRDGFVE